MLNRTQGNVTANDNNLPEVDQLLSLEAAAKICSVSIWTMRKWVSEHKIKSAKLGSRRLIPMTELKRFINDAIA